MDRPEATGARRPTRYSVEGKIGFFGVSVERPRAATTPCGVVESGAVDTVQVIYNVFDQSPEDELFPACREHGS